MCSSWPWLRYADSGSRRVSVFVCSAVRVKEQVVGQSDGGIAKNEADAAISVLYNWRGHKAQQS